MGKYLAKELEKYFTREKNKVIFRNGMTLNQLALEMWEKLGFKEVDPSVISRVINGERLLNTRQIMAISKILSLSNDQRRELEGNVVEDLATRFGFESSFCSKNIKDWLDSVSLETEKLGQFVLVLNPDFIGDWLSNLGQRLEEKLKTAQPNAQKDILRLLLRLSFLESVYLGRQETKQLIFGIPDVLKRTRVYLGQLKEAKYNLLRELIIGHSLYKAGRDYAKSARCLYRVVESEIPFVDYEIMAWRALVLDCAYLGDRVGFFRIERKIHKLIKSGKYSDSETCSALEGLGRGQAILGSNQFEETIFMARQSFKKLEKQTDLIALRKIQLARSELEISLKRKSASLSYLEDLGMEGFRTAKNFGFYRHAQKIWKLLNVVL